MKMKTTEELKTVPFETYARVLDRAVKAEAERDALRAALAPSPAGREERHEMTSIGDKEPD